MSELQVLQQQAYVLLYERDEIEESEATTLKRSHWVPQESSPKEQQTPQNFLLNRGDPTQCYPWISSKEQQVVSMKWYDDVLLNLVHPLVNEHITDYIFRVYGIAEKNSIGSKYFIP